MHFKFILFCLFKYLEHSPQASEEPGSDTSTPPAPITLQTDEQLQQLVDPLLDVMDKNKDGFISWEEYVLHDQEQKAKNMS